ncbi:MAG: formate dehydrogenase subunit alpha [Arenicellales bacterium]|nr:formate dehydrogenase subunit alpha [Arenicellales bacterium]
MNNPSVESTVELNGRSHRFTPGESILQLARREIGLRAIPTLCDDPRLAPHGACRLCTVEITQEGSDNPRLVAACHTPVVSGQKINTHSPTLHRLRKNIVELVLTDHPMDCLTCSVNGNCELQKVAAEVGIHKVRYLPGAHHLDRPADHSHPYLRFNPDKCINCARCIRACDEIQGAFVLGMGERGFKSRVIADDFAPFGDSTCVSCGACLETCPTAAIDDRFHSKSLQAEKRVRTVCSYCGVGCNLEVSVVNNEVRSIRAAHDSPVNLGHTCLKGRFAFGFYNHPDRLQTPLIRNNGVLVESSWDEAISLIAAKLNNIREEFGPDSIAGISSSRCTNEENYLMQKFFRAVIGTNNIDCCARVCHSPTALGMQQAFGTGAATNSIEDLAHTECMLVVGANPTSAHPVTGAKLLQAALGGKTLIVIDPVKTRLAQLADHHLQLRPGTNIALLNMMLFFIIEADLVDHDFVARRCHGYQELGDNVRQLDINRLAKITGVPAGVVEAAAHAYGRAKRAMSFHGLGVTEHSQGTPTVRLISNLAMITGNLGRQGAGVNPLRGQNNVQGAADMGCQPHQGAGYLDLSVEENRAHYETFYHSPLSATPGLKIPQMYEAALDNRLKALWVMGEDIIQTEPNTDRVKKAVDNLDFLIVQELFLTETAKRADVVLPGTSSFEKSGTFTNGERRVQRVNASVDPLPGSRPDGQIIIDIMNQMGYPQPDYDPAVLLEEISRVVPFLSGVSWEGLGDYGKQWPVKSDGSETRILHTETFKHGKGILGHFDFEDTLELVEHSDHFPFILTTSRDLVHYNSGTMTRRTHNVEIMEEDTLLINTEDARSRGIEEGDRVRLKSARGEVELSASVSSTIKPGILFTTFHFPEKNVNHLTSDVADHQTLCPEYKVVATDIERVGA